MENTYKIDDTPLKYNPANFRFILNILPVEKRIAIFMSNIRKY